MLLAAYCIFCGKTSWRFNDTLELPPDFQVMLDHQRAPSAASASIGLNTTLGGWNEQHSFMEGKSSFHSTLVKQHPTQKNHWLRVKLPYNRGAIVLSIIKLLRTCYGTD